MKASYLIKSNNRTTLHHKPKCKKKDQTFMEEPEHSEGVLIMAFMARVKWNKNMKKTHETGMKSMAT